MRKEDIPVVILCGGKGTRIIEFTETLPKPMVPIGGKPILWHIMKFYSHYGYKNFILTLGYKGELIKNFLMNYRWISNDFILNTKTGEMRYFNNAEEDWNITFVDTGLETNTGGRVKKIEKFIETNRFMLTYGDGLADIDINELLNFHIAKGKTVTLTGVIPFTTFGVIKFTRDNVITDFKEKPKIDSWINGGFFVCEKDIFDYLKEDDVLEKRPLQNLVQKKHISIFKHNGFWKCLDTYKDYLSLNETWSSGNVPWKVWDKNEMEK